MKQSIKNMINNISLREWSNEPYSRQSWGSWLHRISPYVGRIKPAFAHFLIKYASKEGDVVLDPFGGIGTIPTEGMLMGRNTISNDLNPYANYIAKAKSLKKQELSELINYINSIEVDTSNINLDKIPDWVKEYYNQDTLKEILFFKDKLEHDEQYFLLGNLIGISQGHRPGHLSKPCAWTLPYKPKPDDKGEYREVKPRLIDKIKRTYKDDFQPTGTMKVLYGDARKLAIEDNSVDTIITSPPYFDTLDYINSSRLRLAICGYYDESEKKELKKKLIQQFDTYLPDMEICISEFKRVLKKGGNCIIIVGDVFKKSGNINTAEELKPIFEKYGFKCHAIIPDGIPVNKSVQKRTAEQKFDRIMILTLEE
jgi:DNA modification methylase